MKMILKILKIKNWNVTYPNCYFLYFCNVRVINYKCMNLITRNLFFSSDDKNIVLII